MFRKTQTIRIQNSWSVYLHRFIVFTALLVFVLFVPYPDRPEYTVMKEVNGIQTVYKTYKFIIETDTQVYFHDHIRNMNILLDKPINTVKVYPQ